MKPADPQAITLPLLVSAKHEPNQPPPAIRLRRWLKIGLRSFGIQAKWAPAAPPPPPPEARA